jgi:hypothetical protein
MSPAGARLQPSGFGGLHFRNVLVASRGICNLATIPGNIQGKKIQMAFRVLLRSRSNGLFVSGEAAWSPDAAHAQTFPTAKSANAFAAAQKLKGMELVVIRENGPELRIPLDPTPPPRKRP